MKKELIVEFDLDVYGWFKDRERMMGEIEQHIRGLFTLHRRDTGQVRRTGCFHVELSLPSVEREYTEQDILNARKAENAAQPTPSVHPVGPECTESCLHGFGCTAEEQQAELDKSVLNAVKSQGYYCCAAPFGEHEPDCKNYRQPLTLEDCQSRDPMGD